MKKMLSILALILIFACARSGYANDDNVIFLADQGFDDIYLPDVDDPDFDADTDLPYFNQWTVSGWNNSDYTGTDGISLMATGLGEGYDGVQFNENSNPPLNDSYKGVNHGYMAITTNDAFTVSEDNAGTYQIGLNFSWLSAQSESDHLCVILHSIGADLNDIYDGIYNDIVNSRSMGYQIWTNEKTAGDVSGSDFFGIEPGKYGSTIYSLEEGQAYGLTVMLAYDGYFYPERPYSTLDIDAVLFREAIAVPAPAAIGLALVGTALARRFRR